MNIGTNIYALRKEKKITQAQLAEKLGVSEQSVSKWENNQCAPDVNLIPIIAGYFGVSIDHIFGFHINSYTDEVKKIMDFADESMDTYKEIEIISEGLKKYPNSPDLKLYLAFSLSIVNRISEDKNERNMALKEAIKLCQEVIDTCGDIIQVDNALNMLSRIYIETQNYSKAEDCISKISADRYYYRIIGMVNMLGGKKCYAEKEQYAEDSLMRMYWTMSHIFESITYTFVNNNELEKALAFLSAHEKLLSIFDDGCENFYATYKIYASELKADIYMKIGAKEKCFKELEHFFKLAEQVKKVAKCADFNVAARNPIYFSSIKDDFSEEYMSEIHPERVLCKYDEFFGDDEKYLQFKRNVAV